MKLQRDLLVPLTLCFAFGCSSPGTDDGESAEDTAVSADIGDGDPGDGDGDATDTSTIPGDGDPMPIEPVATITGAVVDAAGNPLPGAGVQFCGPINDAGEVELCISVDVAEDATFEIGAMTAALWSLKVVHGPLDARRFAGQAFQIDVVDGVDQDFSNPPIVVPEPTQITDLSGAMGETVVMIDGILTMTIDPANAQSPDFASPTELGGIAVPPEQWRHVDINGAPVTAAWAFTPFGTKAKEGFSFGLELNDALGLAANDTVTVYELEKDNGSEHEIATGVVNGDASAIDLTPVGNGFHELSWIFVVPD